MWDAQHWHYRHNKVAGYIHRTIYKDVGLQVTDRHCEHVPERVVNVNGTAFMWHVPVVTVRTVCIILHGKKERTCLLIDIATPDDSDVNKQKKLKN